MTPASATAGTPILAGVTVTNTGTLTGDEIVQLYLNVDFASPDTRTIVPMPVKQLRGFQRITLAPGQAKTVSFTLGPEELSFWCWDAVDGDLATRWSSQFSDPQWIYVDLGAPMRIERVILRWETAYGQAYRIQTSNDASAWTDIYSTTAGDGEVDNPAVSGTGRYLRMHSTQPPTDTPTPTQNAADANAYGYPDVEAHAHDHAGADRHFHSFLWSFRLR